MTDVINYNDFLESTKKDTPPGNLEGVQLALWYALKDNWDMAHKITQDIHTDTASWIHAYLHRVEGDNGNANYWYRRCNKSPYSGTLKNELNDIIKVLTT